jgi:hypothetical protein
MVKKEGQDRTGHDGCGYEVEQNIYHKFDNIDGGKIGTKSRDAMIENTGKKLFSFFLTFKRKIWVNTGATVNSNSPTTHVSLFFFL